MEINGYTYTLRIEKRTRNTFLEIKNPFTVDFTINKTNFKGSNSLSMKVYGLSKESRDSIRKDQAFHVDVSQRITFSAGKDGVEPIVFNGKITSCSVVKEGVDMVTLITAFDDGLSRSSTSRRSYSAGTSKQTIVNDLISDLAHLGIQRGYVSPVLGNISRGISIFKKTTEALYEFTDGKFEIQDMRANVYGDRDPMPAVIQKIKGSRLLNTPTSQSTNIFFEIFFEPGLVVGQDVLLESSRIRMFNGKVNIISLNHKGRISDRVASSVTTTVGSRFFITDDIARRIMND